MEDTRSNKDIQSIYFYQGSKQVISDNILDDLKTKISELSNLKNVNFFFGSGTSSNVIPTMDKLQEKLECDIDSSKDISKDIKSLYNNLKTKNLEYSLGILYSNKNYLEGLNDRDDSKYQHIVGLIKIIEQFMYKNINVDLDDEKSNITLNLYKKFYQKTTLRNKDLSRLNVFTTNNDLFNEKALDSLNINFNNGFGGGLEKVFNPARFNFTYSRKIDSNLDKFEPLENMIYLFKLHGSISWVQKDGNDLFDIHEETPQDKDEKDKHVLIYPTPLKQNLSLGSPYSDLIREFKVRLGQDNSVLFIIGYSFSDEHINNIIYQSLAANSSLSIFIFGEHKGCPLTSILDNRIYNAFGTIGEIKIHYFDYIVNNLLPNLDKDKDSSLLIEFKKSLNKLTSQDAV